MADKKHSVTSAAEYIGRKPKTLDNWRSLQKGPDYIKAGHGVIYRQSALDKYLKSREVKCFQP